MKLLFDQNLSIRLPYFLRDFYPGSAHVFEFQLETASDDRIWELAIAEQFVIVSKDSDLYQMSLVRGTPPKVIWVRTGNCSTREIVSLLQTRLISVNAFFNDEASSFLVLS